MGWLLAPWGVSVLFQRGAFTAENTQAVAQVLRWGLLQLPFYFGVLILVQLLASQNRYRLMSGIAVANFALKAALNAVLAPRMGAAGIMLATSLMYLLSLPAIWPWPCAAPNPKRPTECPPFKAPPARSACCCSFIRCTAAAPSGWPWT